MLERIPLCKECGVPILVGLELRWDNNGVINSKSSPGSRWVFFESGSFDPIFRHIEELIGMPIKNIIIESRRNEARKYMAKLFPQDMREAFATWGKQESITAEEQEAKFLKTKEGTIAVFDVARVYGYADSNLGESWDKKADYPWRRSTFRNPYSVSLFVAEALGSCEAFEDKDLWIDYTLVGDVYHLSYYPSEHPLELKGRAVRTPYTFKSGEIEYERCPECGIPREISRYRWDLEAGEHNQPRHRSENGDTRYASIGRCAVRFGGRTGGRNQRNNHRGTEGIHKK